MKFSHETHIGAQPQAFHDYIYQRYLNSEHTDDVNLAFLDKKKIDIISVASITLK